MISSGKEYINNCVLKILEVSFNIIGTGFSDNRYPNLIVN